MASIFNAADKTTPGFYGPSQTALLLLDFHNLFVEKLAGPKAGAAVDATAKMSTWARSKGIQVIHCLIDLEAMPFSTCKGADKLADILATLKEGGGEEPAELLKGGGDDVTFTRRAGHVSALKSPGLDEFLQRRGIKSLILTGLSTSGCVTRTALAANDAEFIVSVLSDGCADGDQGVHDTMVGKILNNRGYVTTAAEFQEGFRKAMEG